VTRVMQVMAGAEHGGAEAFFTRLVPALHRAGIDQHAAIRGHRARGDALSAAGIPVVELRFGGAFDLVTGPRLRAAAKAYDPDILIAWMSRAARFAPTGRHVLAGRLGGYYDLKYYRRCDHLIGNTEDICAWLTREGWPTDRVWYLPNFVDDTLLPPVDRAILDTPSDAPLLLGLGRLHANKGFDVALAALAKLPRAWLWLAGEGPERAALTALAARLGVAERVRFLGWRDDVPALLAAADVFLCPSRHEPLGNVVIEAWARSTPVVAAASQGPRELIEPGVSGLLVPIDDADALAAAAAELLDDPARAAELGRGGHDAWRRDFTEAASVARWLDFFDRVAR